MLLSSVNLSISLSELNWVPGYPLAGKHVKASTSTHAHTRTVFYSSKSMCWHTLPRFCSHSEALHSAETNYHSGVSSCIYLGQWESSSSHCFSILPSAFCLFIPSTLSSLPPSQSLFLPVSPSLAVLLRLDFCRLCSVSDKRSAKVWISDRQVLPEENWSCSSQEHQWCSSYTKMVVLRQQAHGAAFLPNCLPNCPLLSAGSFCARLSRTH